MILGGVLVIAGIVGCFMPIIPGPPLTFAGMIAYQISSHNPFSVELIVIFGAFTAAVTIFDYFLPSLGARYSGGSKKGTYGSIIGMIAGFFLFPPLGIIIFPFVGAVVGELTDGKKFTKAMKAGFGTFLGFLAGTFIKLLVCGFMLFFYIRAIVLHYAY